MSDALYSAENKFVETIKVPGSPADILYAIFDHDGTISVLREGWEEVMLPVMLESICGASLNNISEKKLDDLTQRCKDFISQTTGSQTIIQMIGLSDMVRSEGYVGDDEVKSGTHYKEVYLDRLMEIVNSRIKDLEEGRKNMSDFTINGVVNLLKVFKEKGVKMYLASGTDQDNVIEEANKLGYAHYFDGGVFGSIGNEIGDAKRKVIQRILDETSCKGENLVVLGDGPVEIIEGKNVGALCIGIASKEVDKGKIDPKKRERLIRAGANYIIPDFRDLELVKEILNLS